MQHPEWLALSLMGLLLSAIAGFGNQLFRSFRGRTLEAYCRLRGDRDRFGEILDDCTECKTACSYLFIFAGSMALISGGMWLFNLLHSGYNAVGLGGPSTSLARAPSPGNGGIASISLLQLVSYGLLAASLLTCLYSWIPKIVVRNSSSVLLFHTWRFWQAVRIAFHPFRALESLFVAIGLRLSDRRDGDRAEEESLEDEIRTLAIRGERKGLVTRSMREMIAGVMNLDEGQVSQIMTPRSKVDAIDIEWSWERMMEAVAQSGRTRMPVYEGSLDHIIGILFVKDLMVFLQQQEQPEDPSQLRRMLRETWMIPATRQVDELLKDFLVRRSHMAIVVDEFQQTLGVVTIEDALEEIVGEIADELDVDETLPMYVEDSDGGFSLAGVFEVAAANRLHALELPESDDYETVAGLVVSHLGSIPKLGTKIRIGKYQFVVTQCNARQVQRVRLTLAAPSLPAMQR